MKNISEESLRLLNEQLKSELHNSQKYRYIGSYLKRIGLNNIGDYFLSHQVNEEISHCDAITNYINDRDEKVLTHPIPSGNVEFNSLTELADLYLELEQQTTMKLSVIASQALSEGDFMLYDFMLEMVRKQREEEDHALSFKNRADMAQNDMKIWLLWDADFKI